MAFIAKQQKGQPVSVAEISKNIDVSVKYLEQLLIALRKNGFVKSVRGARGGFLLTKNPEEITIGDIVHVLEARTDLVPCLANSTVCLKSKDCQARKIWQKVSTAMFDELYSHTLSSIVGPN